MELIIVLLLLYYLYKKKVFDESGYYYVLFKDSDKELHEIWSDYQTDINKLDFKLWLTEQREMLIDKNVVNPVIIDFKILYD